MPPRNDHEVRRLEEYERRSLDSIERLFQEVEKLKIAQAVMQTKLSFIAAGCGVASSLITKYVEHMLK